jgi:hypothetical protein
MKAPGYFEKRDKALKEAKAVEKVRDEAPKGAKKYIELRKKDLKKVRGY